MEEELGFPVTIFVPPFNSFDINTISALKNEGFKLISAGMNFDTMALNGVKYLPGGPYPFKLRSVIQSAINKKHYDALIVCSMHSYDMAEFAESLPAFRIDNKQVSIKKFISDLEFIDSLINVQLISVSDLFETDEDLTSNRFNANKRLWNNYVTKYRLLPNTFGLGVYPINGLYYSFDTATDMFHQQIVVCVLLYLFILLFSYYIIRYLILGFLNFPSICLWVSISGVLGLICVMIKIYLGEFYFLAAFITLISISGLFAVRRYCHRQ